MRCAMRLSNAIVCLLCAGSAIAFTPLLTPSLRVRSSLGSGTKARRLAFQTSPRRTRCLLKMYEPEQKTETIKTIDAPEIQLCNSMDAPLFDVNGPNEDRINLETLLRPDDVLEIAYQRVIDTAQDISVIVKRALNPKKGGGSQEPAKARRRVVLVGSGWGAHALTKILDDDEVEVIVVSPRSYFIFTPMLASSAVGTVEYRSITEPMRFSNRRAQYIEATAQEIDPDGKRLRCQTPSGREISVPYDSLVLSVGMQTSTFGTPGVAEHCFFLKDVDDARALRAGLIERFEAASLPDVREAAKRQLLSFVVVGGGPTGVEFSGELFDFLSADVQKFYPDLIDYVTTTLIQAGPSILPVFSEQMRQQALDTLRSYGTRVLLKTRVQEVAATEISCVRKAPDGQDPEPISVPYGLCVWAAGNAPRPISERFISEHQPWNRQGRILTDGWLRVLGLPGDAGVFAIGDCAGGESGALPQTAQVAAQQGAYLARLLNKEHRAQGEGRAAYGAAVAAHLEEKARSGDAMAKAVLDLPRPLVRPFQFLSLGILAYTGKGSALAEVELVMEAQGTKEGSQMVVARQGGWAGFLLWRSVYITKQVALRNRVLVLFDWMQAKVFGRDISAV